MYRVGLPFWKVVALSGVSLNLRVDVIRDEEAGVYVGTSPHLDGLVVEAPSMEELMKEAQAAAELLLEGQLNGRQPCAATDFRLIEGAHCAA